MRPNAPRLQPSPASPAVADPPPGVFRGIRRGPAAPVVAVASLLALLATLGAAGCDRGADQQPAERTGTDTPAVVAPPDGRVKVEVGEYGYSPATIAAAAGKPLTLAFRRTTDKGCGGEVVFPERDIHRKLPVGETVEIAFTPTTTGRIAFTCGMGMYEGAILVSEGH